MTTSNMRCSLSRLFPGATVARSEKEDCDGSRATTKTDFFNTIEPERKSRSYPITSVEPTPMYCPAFLGVIWLAASTAHFSVRRSKCCAVSHLLTRHTSGNLQVLSSNWSREKAQRIAPTVKSRRQADLRRLPELSAARLPLTSSQDHPRMRFAWKFPINHRSSKYSNTHIIKVRCGLAGNFIGAKGSARGRTTANRLQAGPMAKRRTAFVRGGRQFMAPLRDACDHLLVWLV